MLFILSFTILLQDSFNCVPMKWGIIIINTMKVKLTVVNQVAKILDCDSETNECFNRKLIRASHNIRLLQLHRDAVTIRVLILVDTLRYYIHTPSHNKQHKASLVC